MLFFFLFIAICLFVYINLDDHYLHKEYRISCKDMNSLTNNIIIADIESEIDLAARNKEYFMVTNNPGEDIIKHFKKKGFTITEDNNNITISWKDIK